MYIKSNNNICSAKFIFYSGMKYSPDLPQLPHVVEHLVCDSDPVRAIKSSGAYSNAHTAESRVTFEFTCLNCDFEDNVERMLAALKKVQINDFDKNKKIVANELSGVYPQMVLHESCLAKIDPDIFRLHAYHEKCLDRIDEATVRKYWSDNIAGRNFAVVYSSPDRLSILDECDQATKAIRNIDYGGKSMAVSETLSLNDKANISSKMFINKVDLKSPKDQAVYTMLAQYVRRKLNNDLRAAGLIYSISVQTNPANLYDNAVVTTFTVRANKENTARVLSRINFKKELFDSDLYKEVCKYAILSFLYGNQTDSQRMAFADRYRKYGGCTIAEFENILRGITCEDIMKLAERMQVE